jgi:hypothetical protein
MDTQSLLANPLGPVTGPPGSEGPVAGTGGAMMPHIYTGLAVARDYLAEKGLGKNQENKHQGFKFRGIDDLYGILQPALAVSELIMAPDLVRLDRKEYTTANGKLQFYTVVEVRYRFASLRDCSATSFTYAGEAADTGDKSLSKALTMAFKSFVFHAFQIPLNGNDDNDKHVAEEVEGPKLDVEAKDALEHAASLGVSAFRELWKAFSKEDRALAQQDKAWFQKLRATAEQNAQSGT